MSKLVAGLALAAVLFTGCDVSSPTAAASPTIRIGATGATGATGAPGTTRATRATGASTPAPAPTTAPTVAPATPVRTAPPPPPQAAPTIKAIPASGSRGTSFMFQASGFPGSRDIIQTVTLPTGLKTPSRTFTTDPDGPALTSYPAAASHPSGQY